MCFPITRCQFNINFADLHKLMLHADFICTLALGIIVSQYTTEMWFLFCIQNLNNLVAMAIIFLLIL
jgi:hypothetical protein